LSNLQVVPIHLLKELKLAKSPKDDFSVWVYFIASLETKKVKIGHTIDIDKRIKAMITGSPTKLYIMAKFRGEPADEKFLHIKLKKHKSHLEWFYLNDDVLKVIEILNNKGKDAMYDHLFDDNKMGIDRVT